MNEVKIIQRQKGISWHIANVRESCTPLLIVFSTMDKPRQRLYYYNYSANARYFSIIKCNVDRNSVQYVVLSLQTVPKIVQKTSQDCTKKSQVQ